MAKDKLKGRGSVSNPSGRYERFQVVPDVEHQSAFDEEPPPLETIVGTDSARTVITENDSPDVPFDRSINPYRGCEHGCIYCFARPTHAYLGLSPGLDFERRIFAKPMAAARLREELAKLSYRCEAIAIGANTDPYQPVERRLGVTREILEVLSEHRHPVSIVTKSDLVLRDLDLIGPMAASGLASVFVSITTLDLELARRLEPRAPSPLRRLRTLETLAEAGVPVGVLASPMIPGLNDAELERILEAAHEAGARSAGYILIRLPLELADLFREWLEANYPQKQQHVLNLIRGARGGKLYDARFGARMRGEGPYAELLLKRFQVATRRLGMNECRAALDVTQFRVPPKSGDQLYLFSK